MTHNQINYWNLQENKRHNLVGEQETTRHNRATETVDFGNLSETKRHNLATESKDLGNLNESIRHNRATEAKDLGALGESIRHNKATEQLTSRDLSIAAGTLSENIRHNLTSESISNKLADSNVELNEANAALAQVRSTWEALSSAVGVELTQAQKDQIEKSISKLEADIKHLDAQTDQIRNDIYWKDYDKLIDLIESVIPG